MGNTVHNPNNEKWEVLANNVKHQLKSEFNLNDDKIPQKKIHCIPESLIRLDRYDSSEYSEGEGVYGTVFDEVSPSPKVLWTNNSKCDNSIISINDMIELLNEAKEKYGEDARVGVFSDFYERSEYSNCPDEYSYCVQVYHNVEETWEGYYERLEKLKEDIKKNANKKAEEEALIKEFAPDVDAKKLSPSQRQELLLSIYRIKAIQKEQEQWKNL